MSAAYVREHYRVPAKRGGRIRYRGTGHSAPVDGVIVGFRGQYLRVRLDGEKRIESFHPTWMIDYLPPPEVPGE